MGPLYGLSCLPLFRFQVVFRTSHINFLEQHSADYPKFVIEEMGAIKEDVPAGFYT